MNALSPGGLAPADPSIRPASARRGAKATPSAGGDQVRLMVDLEDESAESALPSGGVMLDDLIDEDPGAHPAADSVADSVAEELLHRTGADLIAGLAPDEAAGDTAIRSPGPVLHADPESLAGAPSIHTAIGVSEPAPTPSSLDLSCQETGTQTDAADAGARSDPFAATQSTSRHPPADMRPEAAKPTRYGDASSGTAASDMAQVPPVPVWDRPPPPLRAGAPTQMRAGALANAQAPGRAMASFGIPAQLTGIEVTLSVQIGSHQLPLRDLLNVEPGLLVPLDRMTSEPVDILVNGRLFARGEVVAIGDRFGVRLLSLVDAPDAQ